MIEGVDVKCIMTEVYMPGYIMCRGVCMDDFTIGVICGYLVDDFGRRGFRVVWTE